MNPAKISIVLPTLNERENIEALYARLRAMAEAQQVDYELIFVDDQSTDGTIDLIKALRRSDPKVKYIIMSRRYGAELSLMAGLKSATGDAVVMMDSDLQHPPEEIPRMIEKWREGYEIILLRREEAGHDSFFKKWTEIWFYRILSRLSEAPIIQRFSGFALMDRRAARALAQFDECDPFFRGLISYVGFKRCEMTFEEGRRLVGATKYRLFDMARLALTGITSFSSLPLYFSFSLGAVSIVLALLYALYIFIEVLFVKSPIPAGWPSTIMATLLLGGIQLFSIGVLGIYIGKIFKQTKNRPNYIVAESEGLGNE